MPTDLENLRHAYMTRLVENPTTDILFLKSAGVLHVWGDDATAVAAELCCQAEKDVLGSKYFALNLDQFRSIQTRLNHKRAITIFWPASVTKVERIARHA